MQFFLAENLVTHKHEGFEQSFGCLDIQTNAKTLLTEIENRYLDMYEPALQSTFALLTRAQTANHATSILNHASKQTTNIYTESCKQANKQKTTMLKQSKHK